MPVHPIEALQALSSTKGFPYDAVTFLEEHTLIALDDNGAYSFDEKTSLFKVYRFDWNDSPDQAPTELRIFDLKERLVFKGCAAMDAFTLQLPVVGGFIRGPPSARLVIAMMRRIDPPTPEKS